MPIGKVLEGFQHRVRNHFLRIFSGQRNTNAIPLMERSYTGDALDHGGETSPATSTQKNLNNFLAEAGLSEENLRLIQVDKERLEKFIALENSCLGKFRWIELDYIFERILHYPLTAAAAVYLDDDTLNATQVGKRQWIRGRSLPFRSKNMASRAVAITSFRIGFELVALSILKFLFLGFTVYGVYSLTQVGSQSVNNLFDAVWETEDSNIRRLITLTFGELGDIFKYLVVLPILLSPFIWGICIALWNASQNMSYSHQHLQNLVEKSKAYPEGIWHDYFRWFFPRAALNSQINALANYIRWHGWLQISDREEAFLSLRAFAEKRNGYTKIAAVHAISEIAHGLSFSQFSLLSGHYEKDELLNLLSIKIQALACIEERFKPYKAVWQETKSTEALIQNLYLHYKKWVLGIESSWAMNALFIIFKLGALYLAIKIFPNIIIEIVAYLRCPDKRLDFSTGNFPVQAALFTLDCFLARIKNFGIIPGEPVEVLTRDLHAFDLSGLRCLDLSSKSLNGSQVADILEALQERGVELYNLSLANNLIQDPEGIKRMMPLMGSVQVLDVSGNAMGKRSAEGLVEFSENFKFLQSVVYLNVAHNNFGEVCSAGIRSLGEAFHFLRFVIELNLEGNELGYCDAFQITPFALGLAKLESLKVLILSNNVLDKDHSDGVAVLAGSFGYLVNLEILGLAHNRIGRTNSKGLFQLGVSLLRLLYLKKLDVSYNFMGFRSETGLVRLFESLLQLMNLEVLNLEFNNVGYLNQNSVVLLANVILSLKKIIFLNLARNSFGISSSNGTDVIISAVGLSNSLKEFYFIPQHYDILARDTASINVALCQINVRAEVSFINDESSLDRYFSSISQGETTIDLSNTFNRPAPSLMKKAMLKLRQIGSFTTLNFSSNAFGQSDEAVMNEISIGISFFLQLKCLDFSNNVIGNYNSTRLVYLSNAISKLVNLEFLDLSRNEYMGRKSNVGVVALFNAISNCRFLKTLYLQHNSIGTKGISLFPVMKTCLSTLTRLEVLDLSYNNIGYNITNGTEFLYEAFPAMKSLKILKISNNYLGLDDVAIEKLGVALKFMGALELLDLSFSALGVGGNIGSIALGKGIEFAINLKCLYLNNNFFGQYGPQGPTAILRSLAHLTQLQTINLAGMTNVNPSQAAATLAKRNAQVYAEKCENNLCFDTPPAPVQSDSCGLEGSGFCLMPTSAAPRVMPLFGLQLLMSGLQGVRYFIQIIWQLLTGQILSVLSYEHTNVCAVSLSSGLGCSGITVWKSEVSKDSVASHALCPKQ